MSGGGGGHPSVPAGGDIGRLLSTYEFWVLFLCLLGQYCGHVTVITMQETVCFQLTLTILATTTTRRGAAQVRAAAGLGHRRHRVVCDHLGGPRRSVLQGGWLAVSLSVLSNSPSHSTYTPRSSWRTSSWWRVSSSRSRRGGRARRTCRLSGALTSSSSPFFCTPFQVSTGVVGVVSGVIWTFEFILVIDVATEWDQGFSHQRLLLGLLTGVQCFLAEVPFFILRTKRSTFKVRSCKVTTVISPPGRIIQWLGHANALFFSLLGFTLRLILYSFVYNPWCFVPIDILHGVSFAVAYPCFTSYASTVAPKGSEATTQAIFGATFFGSECWVWCFWS